MEILKMYTDNDFTTNADQCWESIVVKDKKLGKEASTTALCLRDGSIPDDTPWKTIRLYFEGKYPGYTRRIRKGLKYSDGSAIVATGATAMLNYGSDLVARMYAMKPTKLPKLLVMQEEVLGLIAQMGEADKKDLMDSMIGASLAGNMSTWVKAMWQELQGREDEDEESIGEEEKVA